MHGELRTGTHVDTDSTLDFTGHPNGSVPTSFNLTPSTSDYTCQAKDAQGNIIGRLDWGHLTLTLTVKGEMYINGSVYSNIGVLVLHSGSATLYISGTFVPAPSAWRGQRSFDLALCASHANTPTETPNPCNEAGSAFARQRLKPAPS